MALIHKLGLSLGHKMFVEMKTFMHLCFLGGAVVVGVVVDVVPLFDKGEQKYIVNGHDFM